MSAESMSRRTAVKMLAALPALGLPSGPALSAQAGAPPSAGAGKLQVGIVSRHLQWTSLEDAIAVAKEAGFDAIEWNVRKGGHVAPERVEQDLPRAVELTRKAGLAATMITTSIQDAQSPYAESILRAAKAAGIRYYRGGEYFRYDYKRDLLQQLEELKPRIATLVELNRKYGTTWAYHTHSAPGMIGGNVWDIWSVIKDSIPPRSGSTTTPATRPRAAARVGSTPPTSPIATSRAWPSRTSSSSAGPTDGGRRSSVPSARAW